MAARKKKEPEQAATPAEQVAVPADMLAQLMAQIQTLTQEVGDLRSQVAETPHVTPTAVEPVQVDLGEVTQEEIDAAELDPVDMPADFFAGDCPNEPEDFVNEEADPEYLASQFPGLLDEIEAFNESADESAEEVSAEEAGALLAGFDEAMAEETAAETEIPAEQSAEQLSASFELENPPEEPESDIGNLSSDDIAALFASAEAATLSPEPEATVFETVASPQPEHAALTDDDIALQIEQGRGGQEEDEEEDDFDFESLGEEELAQLVRQSIESQAEELDVETVVSTSESEDSTDTGLKSASEIAALLNTPDEDTDFVPSSSTAMSDEELRALLAEAAEGGDDETADVSSFDEKPSVQTTSVNQPRPVTSGGAPELGAVKAVPAALAVRALALPVRFEDGKLVCRVATPIDQAALDRLSKATGFGIVAEQAAIEEVVAGIRDVYAEIQDTHARFAVMAGSQKRPGLLEKIATIWKKPA